MYIYPVTTTLLSSINVTTLQSIFSIPLEASRLAGCPLFVSLHGQASPSSSQQTETALNPLDHLYFLHLIPHLQIFDVLDLLHLQLAEAPLCVGGWHSLTF